MNDTITDRSVLTECQRDTMHSIELLRPDAVTWERGPFQSVATHINGANGAPMWVIVGRYGDIQIRDERGNRI